MIITIHGGAFSGGDKKDGEEKLVVTALSSGYAVASINYRLSSEAEFPAAINDVKAAIRFLRANAVQYELDANHFAVWGYSGRANLAALAATSAGGPISVADSSASLNLPNDVQDNISVSDAVQAAVDWYGPIRFQDMDAQFAQLGLKNAFGSACSPSSPESGYLGATIGGTDQATVDLEDAASPQSHITASCPPFYIQHGDKDANVPYLQSQNSYDALTAAGVTATFEILPGVAHLDPAFETSANVAKIIQFMDKCQK